ncbi:MAG: penicillin-binding protein 2 [Acidobacteriota bacterium]|nr:penicillin-binding protein 2 [Acidobacteriota bacterium]
MVKRKKKINKNPAQTAFTRFMLIIAFFILWIGGISVRLVHLQVNQSEWLRGQALNQRRDQVRSRLLRGTIYDRTERALAMSVSAKSLYADPSEIEDVEKTAREVAAVLKLKPNDILKDLREAKESNKRFVWLARKLDEDAAQKINETLQDTEIKKWDEPRFAGLHWREEQKRSYPYQTLAAQVVGFSNSDDIGQAGIEQSQEEILRGAVIKGWQDRDRLGRVYDESETEKREPPKDIVLTISNSIQYKTEQALEKGVKAANAKSGVAIVLNPKTGEILAMANYPTFDPNKFGESAPETYTNKVLQNVYSPGSVFKIVTYGGALQENLIKADGTIDCSKGFIEVGGRRFNDPHATKTMSYADALAVSSNYAAIKTALGLGKDRFYGYARQFGFGELTGIELPAEARGQLRSPETWNGDSLASMSIGYEVGITALQAAAAYAVIANNGVRIKPHIIKEIRQADGKIVSAIEPQALQIVSAENARDLRQMLQEVVLSGTAKRARLNGYSSAGKTGTAWKYDAKLKKYNAAKYVSSFIGFAPVNNPSVVIAVVMDEPRGGARDGGQVSAPVFREIAEQILPDLNVIPDENIRQDVLTAQDILPEAEIMPTSTQSAPKSKEKTATGEKTKEPKKEDKPPGEDKKLIKQKTAILMNETKNKSSRERMKQKT